MPSSKIAICFGFLCLAGLGFLPQNVLGQAILAEAYLDSADAAREASDIGKAARLYALALTESHGQQHPVLTSRALLGAAAVHIELGELDQAEENARAALALCDALAAPPRELLTAGLNGMAMIAYHRHEYEQSEACYVKLLKDLEPTDANQILRAIVLNDLALVKIALHHPQEGWKLATAAADIMHDKFGSASAHYAQCLDTLAQAYHAGDQLDVAERLSRAALEIFSSEVGADSPQFGAALLTLGKIQHHQGLHLEGAQSTEHAVALQEKHRGAAHPLVQRAKHAHAAILGATRQTTGVAPPTEDEGRMFDEMYGNAGLEPDELTALRDHWAAIPSPERLKQYVDFHAEVNVRREQTSSTQTGDDDSKVSKPEAVPDEEALFHHLFGRHELPPEELQAMRDHWDSLTSEQRRAAAKLYHKSVRPQTTSK